MVGVSGGRSMWVIDLCQWEWVRFVHSRQSDEYQTQSQLLAVQQQLESTEEMLEIRERELQEAKEQVSSNKQL